jgi:3-mercaptopyruvate sulfurtransferase SseA
MQLLDSDKLGDLLAKAGVNDKSKVLVYSEGNNTPIQG